jgi:HEAT repeat protein
VIEHVAHPEEEVRFAVAFVLPGLAGEPPDPTVINALIRLTADDDPDVRDWATFGLGTQLDEDSEAIRDALAQRLDDPVGDTAGEALLGLARRHDPRALPALLAHLDDNPGNLIVEAAAELGAPEALPALVRLRAEGWSLDEPQPDILEDAISACSR